MQHEPCGKLGRYVHRAMCIRAVCAQSITGVVFEQCWLSAASRIVRNKNPTLGYPEDLYESEGVPLPCLPPPTHILVLVTKKRGGVHQVLLCVVTERKGRKHAEMLENGMVEISRSLGADQEFAINRKH